MDNKKFIAYSVAIIVIGAIFSQIIKNIAIDNRLEKQLAQDAIALEYQKEKDAKAEQEKTKREYELNLCLSIAEDDYWNYVELNGTGNRNEKVTADSSVWNTAKKDREAAIDNCYKKYNK